MPFRQGLDRAGLWRHRLKDGSLIDVEITSHTLEFDGRRAELVLAIDVAERRRTEERRELAQAGVAGFLEKPCRLEDLLDVVARVLAEPLGGA